jgi:hypothetical protein
MSGAAVIKATNEPLLSNHWTFGLNSESQAVRWMQDNTQPNFGQVWLGTDRLRYVSDDFSDPLKYRYDIYNVGQFARYAILSDYETVRLARIGVARPKLSEEEQIYDNGFVQSYHFRPRTPYQR